MPELTREENEALMAIAGLPVPKATARRCSSRVGACNSPDHVHPSPGTQMGREEWMLQQGYTREQIRRWYEENAN